jgi:hypothetical protein
MRKIFLLVAAVVLGFMAEAQVTPTVTAATPVTDSLVSLTCNCLKKDVAKIADTQQLQEALGKCLINEELLMQRAVKEHTFTGEATELRQLGRIVGRRLVKECPGFLELSKRLGAAQKRE